MIYANIASSEEQKRLDAAKEATKDKTWYRRLMIITLSAQQYTVQKLSELFHLCETTIRSYVHAYNEGGWTNCDRKPRPGVRRKWPTGRKTTGMRSWHARRISMPSSAPSRANGPTICWSPM